MRAVHTSILLTLVFSLIGSAQSSAQNPKIIKLKLHPQPVPEFANSIRLLPSDFELKSGNAAVVLLRMPWEQNYFMNNIFPKVSELTDLEYNDPKIESEFSRHFGHFRNQMHRAAYIRDADWNYPIGDEPMMGILLPDAQGVRQLTGIGLGLWVDTQIAKGNLDEAQEGILIQFAIARHVCRTPFAVCQLVGTVIADSGLTRLEILMQQPQAKNYYYALSALPNTLGDHRKVFELESRALPETLPSLTDPAPPVGDPAWQQIAAEYAEFINGYGVQMKEKEFNALKQRFLDVAVDELPAMYNITDEQVATMTPEEKVMRLILGASRQFHSQAEAAVSLPLPAAIQKLQELQPRITKLTERLDLPADISQFAFSFIGPDTVVTLNRFSRRVKMLQIVEAIRDHASKHDGALPAALTDIKLHVPVDPATGKSFVYKLDGTTATLSSEPIPGLDPHRSKMPVLQITLAGTEE